MESFNSSVNGVSELSFLSLLMAPENEKNQNEFEFKNSLSLPSPCYFPPPVPEFQPPLAPSPEFFPGLNLIFNETLKTPKIEQISGYNQDFPMMTLPNLLSLENFVQPTPTPPPPENESFSLESILEEFLKQSKDRKKEQKIRRTVVRKKISEKTYCLGKLLPGGHRYRKNTAEMLEDAEKYIRFLHAQISALRSMPTQSTLAGNSVGESAGVSAGGRLGRLSRQQLLQVVVNSPEVQMVMADKGWCVVSSEQVTLMKKIEARKRLVERFLLDHPL